MRRATTMRGKEWIYAPNGDLAGIAMGSDFCSEHEWGVKSLRMKFGTDESLDGIERRIIREVPKELRWVEQGKGLGIFLSPLESYYRQPEGKGGWMDSELRPYGDETVVCAWDEKSFGIAAYGEKDKKNLKVLWEAFQKKDVAFWTNIGVFHIGGGLIFCIASQVPEKDKYAMKESDLDYRNLLEESVKTGIEEELKAAGKRWYALSPKWSKEIHSTVNGKIKTQYPVIYWLNPMEQHLDNYGWWTVEQLREWARGTGPIVMTEKQRKERGR